MKKFNAKIIHLKQKMSKDKERKGRWLGGASVQGNSL